MKPTRTPIFGFLGGLAVGLTLVAVTFVTMMTRQRVRVALSDGARDVGPQGRPGPPGPTGPQGLRGPCGSAGVEGRPGAAGFSEMSLASEASEYSAESQRW